MDAVVCVAEAIAWDRYCVPHNSFLTVVVDNGSLSADLKSPQRDSADHRWNPLRSGEFGSLDSCSSHLLSTKKKTGTIRLVLPQNLKMKIFSQTSPVGVFRGAEHEYHVDFVP
ncbi:hypothetical protein Y032_0015g2674 [Ancylostoma ceylanicum]|uniref:Uncharacterized protein n=1 Tax=Ancylostoma ceylanicum TaxID=53326 RepID=A0A016V913_9BILA|nr:hypothetical protein Y032_0015g2674 [Ancylostoma ceylanicum]